MKLDTNINYNLEQIIWPMESMGQFNEYQKQYGHLSDKAILQEIMKVRGQVSNDLLQKHIKNLDSLAQLQGFTTENQKQKITYLKSILNMPGRQSTEQSNVESQFFFGTSLLLWFLLLTAIWRRPFVR